MSQPDEQSAAVEAESSAVSLRCHILTLFPDFFTSPLDTSIIKRARAAGALDVQVHDIRDHASDKHRTADDSPYGGGAGMVMKADPIVKCIEAVEAEHGRAHRVLLTPQGAPFTQRRARALARHDRLLFLCGRYEGVDERVRANFIDEEISIGDYVLTGGEPAALVVIDAVSRLRPGVLGNADSIEEESFSSGWLEYPQYTRPHDFRGHTVPAILTSGDHGRVDKWRRQQSILRTWQRRPDLFRAHADELTEEERAFLREHAPDALLTNTTTITENLTAPTSAIAGGQDASDAQS